MEKQPVLQGTLFLIEKPFNERGKWLFAFYCISFLAPATWYLTRIVNAGQDIVSILFLSVIMIVCIIAGYRYGNSASRSESLLVADGKMKLIEQNWFYKKQRSFLLSKISNFRYVTRPVLTRHALAGQSFDYLGFQTQQQVINEMFGDNKIAFDYEGRTISFGKNLYSWDFEEMIRAIENSGDNPKVVAS